MRTNTNEESIFTEIFQLHFVDQLHHHEHNERNSSFHFRSYFSIRQDYSTLLVTFHRRSSNDLSRTLGILIQI